VSTHLPSLVVAGYLACTVVIATLSARRPATSNAFLNSTGNLPTWMATISFLAANCGALEIVGLSGVAARYGVQAFHFYWIGAIPAMIFVSFVTLPLYRRSGVRSVPEFLELRFSRRVRLLSAGSLLVSTCLTAGISLYALAQILGIFAGWSFGRCALIVTCVVLWNVLASGFRGTVRTEILHFAAMVLGLLPMLYLALRAHPPLSGDTGSAIHAWQTTPLFSTQAPVDLTGIVIGLGFVIGFSYWCTDFLLMQRALGARTLEASRRVPLYAGFGKLLFSLLVIAPVVLAGRQLHGAGGGALDRTAPLLMMRLYSPGFLEVGMLALVAGLLTGLSGNVSAFASVWTQEIYRSALRPFESEPHYVLVGRIAAGLCLALSLCGAYATLYFESLSQFMLAIFSLTLIPFFGIIAAGALRRTTSRGALAGALSAMAAAAIAQVGYRLRWIAAGSVLSANFYTAILTFVTASVVCLVVSGGARSEAKPDAAARLTFEDVPPPSRTHFLLAALLLALCVLLNLYWR
jgi:SSS family solute:Na+ symporter